MIPPPPPKKDLADKITDKKVSPITPKEPFLIKKQQNDTLDKKTSDVSTFMQMFKGVFGSDKSDGGKVGHKEERWGVAKDLLAEVGGKNNDSEGVNKNIAKPIISKSDDKSESESEFDADHKKALKDKKNNDYEGANKNIAKPMISKSEKKSESKFDTDHNKKVLENSKYAATESNTKEKNTHHTVADFKSMFGGFGKSSKLDEVDAFLTQSHEIFGQRDISSRENLDKLFVCAERKLQGNSTNSVNKQEISLFLDQYKIELVSEVNEKVTGKSFSEKKRILEKAKEREAAIAELKILLEEEPFSSEKGLIVLQLAIRLREPAAVKQCDMPFCGVFASARAGLRHYPKETVEAMIKVARAYLSESQRADYFPVHYSHKKYREPLVDQLFVAYFQKKRVEQGKRGTVGHSKVLFDMGIPLYRPLPIVQGHLGRVKYFHGMNKENDIKFLEKYVKSQQSRKQSVMFGIDERLTQVFASLHERYAKPTRKAIPLGDICNLDEYSNPTSKINESHAVIVEDLQELPHKKGVLGFKLYSWGKHFRGEMPVKKFAEHFSLDDMLVIGGSSTKSDSAVEWHKVEGYKKSRFHDDEEPFFDSE